MEGTPQNINLLSVRKSLLSVHGVVTVYGLHTWSLNMNKSLVSVHVVTEEAADSHIVLTRATNLLRSKFGFSSVTIQVEHSSSTVNGVRTMTVESD
ncbi:zinc transporter 3-like [Cynoglossus semilaevis]|uniref:zinc transporter 3-like n=1 Tax=Cynoglossus semilaevis TaxID=244447 RepID=UPI000497101F|nr:zinc transporter 3-like [Cynoglossus semilaevis]